MRPSFDEYFMMMAFCASLRSEDHFVQVGSVLVCNKTKHIISTGYNGTIRGSDLKKLRMEDREYRRKWMRHAEDNLIQNCTVPPMSLHCGATAYITAEPCLNCLQNLIGFGVTRIVYADQGGTITDSEQTREDKRLILSMSDVKVEKLPMDNPWVKTGNTLSRERNIYGAADTKKEPRDRS